MRARIVLLTALILSLALAAWPQAMGPLLEYSIPSDGSILNNRNQTITLKFTQEVDLRMSVVRVTGPSGAVGVDLSVVPNAPSTLIVTPTSLLTDGVYTVDYSGVWGIIGYPVENAVLFSFTVDATPPSLVSSSPAPGQANVPVDTQISLRFSEPLRTRDLPDPFTMTGPSGQVMLQFVSQDEATNTYVYKPIQPLEVATPYTVDYSQAFDLASNNPLPPASFDFTTAAPPFTLVTSTPANGATGVSAGAQIVLTFSNQLDAQASTVVVTGAGTTVSGTLTVNGPTATFVPALPYSPGAVYTVEFSGVRDAYGQQPAGVTTITFTTLPNPLQLVSAEPSNGEAGVSPNTPVVLTFNNNLSAQASSITVTGVGLAVAGTLSVSGPVATFTPTTGYVPGVLYTVDFAGVRDIYGQTLAGQTQTTFSAAGVVLDGKADPPIITLSAGERAGVTYFIQNRTSTNLTLRSSAAEFYVSGQLVSTINVPAQGTVSANGVAAIASDASISEQIQSAARTAGTDEVIMLRTFTASGADTAQSANVTIPLLIRIGSSLGGPASVTEIVLDVPPDGKTVGQFEDIRGHAFIRGTGTGAIVGTWFVDGQPTETFQMNLTAGLTQEIWSRLTLPTLDLGEHKVELRISRPHAVSSGVRRYVVVPKGSGTQRVLIVSPWSEASLMPGNARISFSWAPMPGSSGYEIAFARDLSALGLDSRGDVREGPLGRIAWNESMVADGQLWLLARVPSDVVAWTPTADQYEQLFRQPAGPGYWAVRAVYPGQGGGDPTTTSKPGRIRVTPLPTALNLVFPEEGAAIAGAEPSFEWDSGPEGSIYEIVILSGGRTVHTALTRDTRFVLTGMSPFKLQPGGEYSWRVSALHPTQGIVAASDRRTFTVRSEPGAQAPVEPNLRPSAAGQAVAITAVGVYLLPGAASELTITPPNGAVIASQQPLISAAYPSAAPGGVLITLNGVDVTALASITPTSATLQPPGVFSEGEHTVNVVVTTASGTQLQETSVFTVMAPRGTVAAAATPGTTDTQQPQAARPLQLDLNWNWRPTTQGTAGGDLIVDLSLRGQGMWLWRSDSYAALSFQFSKPGDDKLDLANFLAEVSFKSNAYKVRAGDISTAESELTAQGLMSRAFNFITNAGPVRLSAVRTLGKTIQRSSIGRAPDVLLVTAETAGSTAQRGLKLTYVDSESDIAGNSSFVGPTKSEVVSLAGHSALGKSGLKLRTEIARSKATVISAFGSQGSRGSAFTATVDGIVAGFGVATSYRRIGSEYVSTASNTLTNNIKGWVFAMNRPLGRFVNSTLNYSTYENLPGSGAPASSLTCRSLDLSANYPKLPTLTLRVAKNDSSSAPFTTGSRPADTEENLWSLTTNYAAEKINGYLSYSKSDFEDFFDDHPNFYNPALDTPNDRRAGTWSFGIGAQPTRSLKLRADWGGNATDRWLRSLLGAPPVFGSDHTRQARVQAEYLISSRVSATTAWARSKYTAALGTYANEFHDFNVRLNYFLKLTKDGGGVTLTGEYRRYKYGGTSPTNSRDEFSILVNDNRTLTF